MKKFLKIFLLFFLPLFLIIFCFFFAGKKEPAKEIKWGITFSQKHTELFGLDWQKTYLSILDDLGAKELRLIAYWDLIEKNKDRYDFYDLDWQIEEAEKRNAKIMLAFGRKAPRWPECHEPEWLKNWDQEAKNEKLLDYMGAIVKRYKENNSIWAWQVENEPLFSFGECPPPDKELLKKEVALVKSLDPKNRPVVLTESGEIPLWFSVAKIGDIVGHTLYRRVWMDKWERYVTYPLPPIFYARKTWLINKIFKKRVICSELQAEPWGPVLLYDLGKEEQEKTMNLSRLKEIIEFAKNTGNDLFYLWGVEWWYLEKEKNNNDIFWKEIKILLNQ